MSNTDLPPALPLSMPLSLALTTVLAAQLDGQDRQNLLPYLVGSADSTRGAMQEIPAPRSASDSTDTPSARAESASD